ncbi:helix-turn-helix domain-containing protein [Enterococcus thailandicus]|uniref:helix-turn-helix domain-containing protein n=1 Tax=Enterococcus thailandicus TaxID=417368 RepID=UPI00244D86B6|nr:hypothetical protein K4E_06510 [Enterococcus thailandicus]
MSRKKYDLMDEDLMTAPEASHRWGYDKGYVRQMYQKYPDKIPEGEIRKFGKTLIITRYGMEQLTGSKEPKITYHLVQDENGALVKVNVYETNSEALEGLKQLLHFYSDVVFYGEGKKEIKIDYLNPAKTKYGFTLSPGKSIYVEKKIESGMEL